MKKAVISTGNKQYMVTEGQELDVDHLSSEEKSTVSFEPLLIIDGDKLQIGKPYLSGSKVSSTVTVAEKKAEKVTSIVYKAKKRVHKVHGHRQILSSIKITKIA